MAKMIRVTIIWDSKKESEKWLNTDRIISISPGLDAEHKTCEIDFEGYDVSLTIKETARELAGRINYFDE